MAEEGTRFGLSSVTRLKKIQLRYGLKAAFDYVVAEKLLILPMLHPDILNSRESCPGLFRA